MNTIKKHTYNAGFSMIELLMAMGVFLMVTAAAFTMLGGEQTTYQRQQGQVGINVALRNATTQLQMDLYNAGTAYFQGVNIPAWPVGITVINNVVPSTSSCYDSSTFAYGSTCFDVINVVAGADPASYPPVNTTDSTGANGGSNCSLTSGGVAYSQAASGLTLSQTAAKFVSGDKVLFLTSNGLKMTSVVLTSNAAVAGSAVRFNFNATTTSGTNSLSNDPLNIAACNNTTCPTPNHFGNQYCGGDWLIKLSPITFQVDSSDPANPKLTRIANGETTTVMEQVIGFKVGATIFNTALDTVSTQYNYDASTYANSSSGDEAWNYTLIRSLRVSLIGRTKPNNNPTYRFRNLFDNGPYQVEGMSVVVNPRNMSMND